ncbi:MAG: carbon dioxide-concentrating mechanism protein CcmK [Cyanobacteria bacterium P01_D01_bin.73]
MPVAIGVVESLGFPATLACADAMVKAARVTLVFFDKAEKGNFYVAVRGPVSEVERSVEAGILASTETMGGKVMSHYIVPNPPPNVEEVLDMIYTDKVEPFRV